MQQKLSQMSNSELIEYAGAYWNDIDVLKAIEKYRPDARIVLEIGSRIFVLENLIQKQINWEDTKRSITLDPFQIGSDTYKPNKLYEEAGFNNNISQINFKLEKFKKYNLQNVYHLTSAKNVSGILRQGIRSRIGLRSTAFFDIANEDVNARRFERLVPFDDGTRPVRECSLCFLSTDPPMIYAVNRCSKDELRWVVVNLKKLILLRAHLAFSDGNIAANRSYLFNSLEELDKINWFELRCRYHESQLRKLDFNEWKRVRGAEILVWPFIPPEAIEEIWTPSQRAVEQTCYELGDLASSIKVKFHSDAFFRP